MDTKTKIQLVAFLAIDVLLALLCFWQIERPSLHFGASWLLNPQGIVAEKERTLILTAVGMMLIVAIPVYFLIFFFAWKYNANRQRAKESEYSPDLQHNAVASFFLWAVPIVLIASLSVLNWKSTHELDPTQPIASTVAPITVEVVALQWKFLFIYPQQNIASVNLLEFPVNTPLNFELTADAPMSSFWIPQLGSQIYAMPAMSTQLHLIANSTGDFPGMDTEINGAGFSGMKFTARSTSQADFDAWVASVKSSSSTLDAGEYSTLSQPSEYNAVATYSSVEPNLYSSVMMKYMMP